MPDDEKTPDETPTDTSSVPVVEEPDEKVNEKAGLTVTKTDDESTVQSENFTVHKHSRFGTETVSITPNPWVGPAPLNVHPDRVKELIKVLRAL